MPGKVRAIGSGPTRYVQGIDGLSEFDRGSGSGWMYSVNGVFPNYSADSYTLKPNDVVAWRYTLDLGKDLGAPSDGGNSGGAPTGGTGGAGGGSSADTVIDVPKDQQQDYVLKAGKDQQGSITLNIPDAAPKVVLNVAEAKDGLPQLTANKGNLIFTIGKGTKLVSGGSAIELFAAMDTADAKLLALVDGSLTGDVSVDAIRQAFTMGAADQSFLFDAPLTITVKGGKGQLAGYIEGGVFTPIPLFASDEEGKQATKGSEKITYAYVDGSDLVIKTNHFTSFVTYTTKKQEQASVDLSKRYADADRISAWALESVKEATMQGFLQGSGGKLNPQAAVTRAEFVKLLVSALGIPADSGSSTSFKDVPGSAWYRPYVQAAYKAGFVTGDGDRFNPNDTITREQMAAMVVRALALDPAAGTAAPADLKKVSPWAQSAVQAILAAQIMNGEGSGFNPAGKVTREMAAVVAVRSQAYLHNGADPSGSGSGSSSDKGKQAAAERQIALTASYLQKTVPSPAVSTLGGEWTVLGLARSGLAIPASYYDAYEANLKQTLEAKSGVLHSVKYTEYDRVILALSAMGKSVTNAAGYSLLEKLADFDALTKQGINGPIFALIALDSKQYAIPAASGAKTQTTRELLVDYILKRHAGGGGWALGEGSASDPDVTAMAIQALAPYAGSSKEVRSAIDEALAWLSANQQADGGFASNGANNAESAAQVVVALTGLGIDPHADARFVKNGHSAIDALLGFAAADGGFYHVKTGEAGNGGAAPGVEDPMAADQSMYALVAYDRLLKGQTRLYDMTDVKAVL
ncbi:DUF4430 domain-containing protein [Paenibacillus lycopersici]|uniref:DUF4430 domain-containing protein n=1 Tax=Paenibacillus lycopersici TaxID=2704462 RepID=A0A6C0FWH6_9BACL|nr:S-layer homology domain-containing protein [Paenibacillus lycopersici]QHT59813.1 DUF4430 domain-containing protein [Paenibacillus lycopersici]